MIKQTQLAALLKKELEKGKKDEFVSQEELNKFLEHYNGADKIVHSSEIIKLVDEKGIRKGMSTGISDLDILLGGFYEEQVIVVTAFPKSGKCHGKGTKILMFDGTIKNVEDLKVGDKLMGPDNKPKNVLSLCHGREEMFKINYRNGDGFVANKSHILSLKNCGYASNSHWKGKVTSHKIKKGDLKNISIEDYLKSGQLIKHHYKLWQSNKIDWNRTDCNFEVDPYFLGLWLGDGTALSPEITSSDKEIIDYIYQYANSIGNKVKCIPQKRYGTDIYSKASSYYVSCGKTVGSKNKLTLYKKLKSIGVIGNKHIPDKYKFASEEVRLKVLAGIIDTDGYKSRNKYHYYDLVLERKVLFDDVVFVARSLGFAVSTSIKTVNGKDYYRMSIRGEYTKLPIKVKRKIINFNPKRTWLACNFEIKSIGDGDYYGFTLDGDGLYLLADFTVTHNTQFSLWTIENMKEYNPVFFALEQSPMELVEQLKEKNMSIPSFYCPESIEGSEKTTDWIHLKIVESQYKSMKETGKPTKIAFIDHFGYIVRPKTSDQATWEIIQTMQKLKEIAKQTKIAIVVIVHTTKANETEPPTTKDLFGSAGYHQEADTVLSLWRETYTENKVTKKTNNVLLQVLANRKKGDTGAIKLTFNNGRFDRNDWLPAKDAKHEDDIKDFIKDF